MKKSKLLGAMLAGIVAFSGLPASGGLTEPLAITASAASKLAAPANVKASVTDTTVKLTWSKVTGAAAYRVYMYDILEEKYMKYEDVGENTCTIKYLNAGRTYKFRVAALVKTDNGYSVQTKSKAVKAAPKLSAPRNLKATVKESSVTLSWSYLYGADAYRVYKYDSKTKKYVKYKNVRETKCTIDGLTAGKTYKFRVAALVETDGGYKVQTKSEAISATPKKPDPVTLPNFPALGSGSSAALKKLAPIDYTVTGNSEEGIVYTCRLDDDGYNTVMLIFDKDDHLSASAYIVYDMLSPAPTDYSALVAAIKAKNGTGKVYKEYSNTVIIWEKGDELYYLEYADSSLYYVEASFKYGPENLRDEYKRWLAELSDESADGTDEEV